MTATATRSAVIALREERRAMRDGCAFLDEKCLLLAAAMLAELRRREALERELAPLQERARLTLAAALARHGLNGLECQPPADASAQRLVVARRSLLGVALVEARIEGTAGPAPPAANPSPEAAECRVAFAALLPPLARVAAIDSNLARLHAEYKRTARRVRALEDVLLPEIERDCDAMETALSELERDEAVWARFARRRA
jgi:V/A-type H+/Na+-transporting ATPase subunit D